MNSGSDNKVIINSSHKRCNRKYSGISKSSKQSLLIDCKIAALAKEPDGLSYKYKVRKKMRIEKKERESIIVKTDMRSSLSLGAALLLTIAITSSIIQSCKSEHSCGHLGSGTLTAFKIYSLIVPIVALEFFEEKKDFSMSCPYLF